jgi:Domain of unknown function (DUF4157)
VGPPKNGRTRNGATPMPEAAHAHAEPSAVPVVKVAGSAVHLQRACDCGGSAGPSAKCAECEAEEKLGVRTKLTVNTPGDAYEQEADRVADLVVAGRDAGAITSLGLSGPADLQRREGASEEEEDDAIQKKPASGAQSGVCRSFSSRMTAAAKGGRPLDAATRAAFEPRFGHDLSHVRLHDDAAASGLSRDINARAFAHGNDIYFSAGQFDPHREVGRRLLAHEITHTLQQGGGSAIRRLVHSKSVCPPNAHGAPAKPLDVLTDTDKRAAHLSLGTSHVLNLESVTFTDPVLSSPQAFNAYKERFGTAPKSGSNWRSRFRKKTFSTEKEAVSHELDAVSENYRKIAKWFEGDVRYRCPGTASYTIPGCAEAKCGTAFAQSCPGSRTMGVCPAFWSMVSDDSRAATLIHEAVHARLGFRGHKTATLDNRIRNPECYEAVVSDVYGLGLASFNCPKV